MHARRRAHWERPKSSKPKRGEFSMLQLVNQMAGLRNIRNFPDVAYDRLFAMLANNRTISVIELNMALYVLVDATLQYDI